MAIHDYPKNFGFTLIEIILTIAIISIIAGTSYVALTKFNSQQTLNSAYENFKNNLNLAKSNASSQVNNCSSLQTLVGYRMNFPDVQHYNVQAVCQAGNNQVINTTRPSKLLSGVEFSSTYSPILFLVITGEVKDIPEAGAKITLTGSNGSTRSLTVFPNGRIE